MLKYRYLFHAGDKEYTEREWKVGERYNAPHSKMTDLTVWASGPELEFIRENYKGLPMARHLVTIKWTGEFAHFILDNLW